VATVYCLASAALRYRGPSGFRREIGNRIEEAVNLFGLLAQIDADVIEKRPGLLRGLFGLDQIVLRDVDRREDDVDVAWERILHVAVFRVLFLSSPRAGEFFGQASDVVDLDIQME
jgi:hypothetical protein